MDEALKNKLTRRADITPNFKLLPERVYSVDEKNKRLKRNNVSCKEHSFCSKTLLANNSFPRKNITYTDSNIKKEGYKIKGGKEVIEGLETLELPSSREQERIHMTIETISDWYAQSINRSYRSISNPKKSYHTPAIIQQVIRKIFGIKTRELTDETKNEIYFRGQDRGNRRTVIRYAERKKWEKPVHIDYYSKLLPK